MNDRGCFLGSTCNFDLHLDKEITEFTGHLERKSEEFSILSGRPSPRTVSELAYMSHSISWMIYMVKFTATLKFGQNYRV